MCTLTYLPNTKNGRVITANRDESPSRKASVLSEYRNSNGIKYFIAKEPLRGGTNVAISPGKRMSVLLNGAFEPHRMGGEYLKSRGILLLESLEFQDSFHLADNTPFTGIEPFTLIDFQENVKEIRWDGKKLHQKTIRQDIPHIWASAQLYSKDTLRKRELWFSELLQKSPDGEDVLKFHFEGGDGDPENDLVMNRDNLVRTVSITQMRERLGKGSIHHYDLLENQEQHISFD